MTDMLLTFCRNNCSTKFLVASSRWNPAAGRDVALVRLSEVADWEEGGRTSNAAAARIFSKEATEGPRRVLIARREVRLDWGEGWRKCLAHVFTLQR